MLTQIDTQRGTNAHSAMVADAEMILRHVERGLQSGHCKLNPRKTPELSNQFAKEVSQLAQDLDCMDALANPIPTMESLEADGTLDGMDEDERNAAWREAIIEYQRRNSTLFNAVRPVHCPECVRVVTYELWMPG